MLLGLNIHTKSRIFVPVLAMFKKPSKGSSSKKKKKRKQQGLMSFFSPSPPGKTVKAVDASAASPVSDGVKTTLFKESPTKSESETPFLTPEAQGITPQKRKLMTDKSVCMVVVCIVY
jgi:hypothetical protein